MIGRSRPVLVPVAAMLALGALGTLAGCSASRSTAATTGSSKDGAAIRCGNEHTAAGVPVVVEVSRGRVGCQLALAIERDYARAFASGKVPGNGGGAPVKIQGWVCQGFNTPEVLSTGRASACHKGTAEILAVLPAPSPSASSF
jgi:hypothetical protein